MAQGYYRSAALADKKNKAMVLYIVRFSFHRCCATPQRANMFEQRCVRSYEVTVQHVQLHAAALPHISTAGANDARDELRFQVEKLGRTDWV
jgi:hypothetical protein